jgi:hypothetical protein
VSRLSVTEAERLEDRETAALYGRVGLDPAGFAAYSRLTGQAWEDSAERMVVLRADVQRVLLAVEFAARRCEREIPTLQLPDEEYERLVGDRLAVAYDLARGVTPVGLNPAGFAVPGRRWLDGVSRLVAARHLAAALSIPLGTLLIEDPAVRDDLGGPSGHAPGVVLPGLGRGTAGGM